jgi:choline dehydrogenase-like flavoprotein
MIEDARSLPGDTTISADLVIVGGGAAGIALALNFVNEPFKVVLLESGGLNYERKTQALYRGKNIGLRYEPLDLCRVRMLGGSTDWRGWAGWCKLFSEGDFEQREWVRLSGWPIGRREIDAYYQRALETTTLPLEIEALAAAEASGALPLKAADCENDPVALTTAPRLASRWLQDLKASKSVRVILHANATQIETNSEGKLATRVRFATLQRRISYVSARAFVIATGGIETPRLMLLSDETVSTGLGNAHGWVGRCFMDHPRFAWGQITHAPNPRLLLGYDPTHGVGRRRYGVPLPGQQPLFGNGLSLSQTTQARERLLGSRTWIIPTSSQGERPSGRELRELVLWATRRRLPSDTMLRVRKVAADLPNAAAAVGGHLRSIIGRTGRWHFVTIVEPEPDPESSVVLDSSLDQLGLRRVRLNWKVSPLVETTLRFTQRAIVKELNSIGVTCFVEGPGGPEANQKVEEPRWVWHHMGTTRMSGDPATGVVDSNCRVHGMDNLYIAGSSVFPTCSTDMPTLTLIALAHRLADHIRIKLTNADPIRTLLSPVAAPEFSPSPPDGRTTPAAGRGLSQRDNLPSPARSEHSFVETGHDAPVPNRP